MKMKIVFAMLMSIAASSTFAAPKIYGEIDVSLDYLPEINANSSNRDVWKVNSNSSFLGIKGEEKLTEHLSAIYLAEWAFYADGAYSCLNIPPIPIHTIPPIPISTIPVKVLIERYRNRGRRFGSSLRFNLIASTLFIIYN